MGEYGLMHNDFETDLEYSLDPQDDKQLDNFYMKRFPTAVSVETVDYKTNKAMQEKGIDKIIHFANGRTVTIDEKKRRADYGDILLELWKNKELKKAGWLFYSQCDYIVYAVLGANKIYLLPMLLLQMAWKNNGKKWLRLYPLKDADNHYYKTVNIAIPTDILLNAMQAEIRNSLFTAKAT